LIDIRHYRGEVMQGVRSGGPIDSFGAILRANDRSFDPFLRHCRDFAGATLSVSHKASEDSVQLNVNFQIPEERVQIGNAVMTTGGGHSQIGHGVKRNELDKFADELSKLEGKAAADLLKYVRNNLIAKGVLEEDTFEAAR
jgi:hypothetical protein